MSKTPVTTPTVAQPSVPEQRAEKVKAPDPHGIETVNIEGYKIQLLRSRQFRQMQLRFGEGLPEDKPSDAVRGLLKNNGFHWNTKDHVWTYQLKHGQEHQGHLEAERVFEAVAEMVRAEKGAGPAR